MRFAILSVLFVAVTVVSAQVPDLFNAADITPWTDPGDGSEVVRARRVTVNWTAIETLDPTGISESNPSDPINFNLFSDAE